MLTNIEEHSSNTNITEESQIVSNKVPLHYKQCESLLTVKDIGTPNMKCFHMLDKSIFLAILIRETSDSFLLSSLVKLIIDKSGKIYPETLSTDPITRVIKNNIFRISEVLPNSRFCYLKYLQKYGKNSLPDYFTSEMLENIDAELKLAKGSEDLRAVNLNMKELVQERSDGASEFAFDYLDIHNKNKSIH